jgi:glycerate 2-kinase
VAATVHREGARLVVGERAVPEGARLVVLAVGKAAAPMARALEAVAGDRVAEGLVVTKAGHGVPLRHMALREAGHPVPDARSEAAGRAALALAARTRPGDVLLVLLSGGASALLSAPLPGMSLADVSAATDALLRAGAEIGELNTVRRHLLAVAGGRLAGAARAHRIEVLAASDVPGDDPAALASGPCAPDPSRYRDALEVVWRRGVAQSLPPAVLAHLEAGAAGSREESLEPGDPVLARVVTTLLVRNADALEGAAEAARAWGARPILVTGSLQGEARRAGRRLGGLARALAQGPGDPPRVLLAGGETAVTVRGRGRGGRSQELALAAACVLDGAAAVTLLAAGTDGSDGLTEAAGAFADGATVARAARLGRDAAASLEDNDSHGFFAAEGGLFVTGPTGTNVMDLVLAWIGPPAARISADVRYWASP